MALWMVRCRKYGEREAYNIDHKVISIGWGGLPDLRTVSDRSQIASLMSAHNPNEKPSAIANWTGQVWTFASVMGIGDLVAMPLKSTPSIMFGRIASDYRFNADYESDAQHFRVVEWVKSIPRSSIQPDLLYSFGAIMTVCRIQRNDAEQRILKMLAVNGPPPDATTLLTAQSTEADTGYADEVDYHVLLLDQIRKHIAQNFDGHALAELVEAVLQAQGFQTYRSPKGPDGGIDVLAGCGALGFNDPRLAVQVKSGGIEVDTSMFREFQGVMKSFGAAHGLYVSWCGFKPQVRKEIPGQYFNVRLWDADQLIEMILNHYESLPATMKARLPLMRTWMLVDSAN